MHRAFAAWLIAKPWRSFLLAAIFGVLSPQGMSPVGVVAGGIPVLMLLATNTQLGYQAAMAGTAAVAAMLLASGQPLYIVVLSVVTVFWAPLWLAQIVSRSGSLSWSFQVAVLAAALVVAGFYVGFEDPVASWQKLIEATAKELVKAGVAVDEKLLINSLAGANWGTAVAAGLVTVLSALFIGCWWHSLTSAPGTFGKEFQRLTLGKVLGIAALFVVIASTLMEKLAADAPYLDAVAWVAATGLLFQGLAAVHALKRLEPTPRRLVLTTMYVLLVFELMLMTVILSVWGVIDRWRKPPAQA